MYYFIINPASRSGKGLTVWKQTKRELRRQGIVYRAFVTRYPRHSIRLTKELCAKVKGAFTLVILGGDGTANEVLSAVPKEDLERITFAYLPSGSSNDLARGLGLPQDPVKILGEILSGQHILEMDYGTISLPGSERHPYRFAVSAGIGFDATVCKEALDSPIKQALNLVGLGKLSYLVIAVKQILTCHTADLTVSVDGGAPVTYPRVFFAAAMNQRFEGGGLPVAPHADPTDHVLSLCTLHGFPKFKAFVILPALMLGGKHIHLKGITLIDCRRADIHTSEPLCVHSDGEYRGFHDRLTFSCSDHTIQVVAGSSASHSKRT